MRHHDSISFQILCVQSSIQTCGATKLALQMQNASSRSLYILERGGTHVWSSKRAYFPKHLSYCANRSTHLSTPCAPDHHQSVERTPHAIPTDKLRGLDTTPSLNSTVSSPYDSPSSLLHSSPRFTLGCIRPESCKKATKPVEVWQRRLGVAEQPNSRRRQHKNAQNKLSRWIFNLLAKRSKKPELNLKLPQSSTSGKRRHRRRTMSSCFGTSTGHVWTPSWIACTFLRCVQRQISLWRYQIVTSSRVAGYGSTQTTDATFPSRSHLWLVIKLHLFTAAI